MCYSCKVFLAGSKAAAVEATAVVVQGRVGARRGLMDKRMQGEMLGPPDLGGGGYGSRHGSGVAVGDAIALKCASVRSL